MREQPASRPSRTRHAAKDTPMRKKPKGTATEANAVLRLRWTLHELPSSQHRAGLAGLALCVEFLKRKPKRNVTCTIENIDDESLTLVVDRAGMQSLFD